MCATATTTAPRPTIQAKPMDSIEMLHLIHLTAAIAKAATEGDLDAIDAYMTILPKAVRGAKA